MNISALKSIVLQIPLLHLGIMVLAATLLGIVGKIKYVIIVMYASVIYWVFYLNESRFGSGQEAEILHTGLFIITSIIFVACSAWIMFMEK